MKNQHSGEANIANTTPLRPKEGFGRIFESMYKGSMVGAGSEVFAIWPYVIAHMRGHGVHGALVELNPELLAFILGSTGEKVEKAIDYLCAADPKSRSQAEEGRRLVRLGQFAYRVVNGALYIGIRTKEDARYKHAQRQAVYEAKKKRGGKPVNARTNERGVIAAEERGDTKMADHLLEEALPEEGPMIAAPEDEVF